MRKHIYNLWAYVFSRPVFVKLNKLLFGFSLRGLGVLNYTTPYLSGEISWTKRYLSSIDKPVVFDVGANVGSYTNAILASFPQTTIYAFEPHPESFRQLTNAAGLLCFNYAVGDQTGTMQLYDYAERDGSSHASLYQGVIEKTHRSKSISHTVEVITLDDFCAGHKVTSIDLLKIDTEGNEWNCLVGAQQLLRDGKIKAILFEFNEMNIISGTRFKDFWEVLLDFEVYRLLPGGELLNIDTYSPVFCEIYAYQNIVALRTS